MQTSTHFSVDDTPPSQMPKVSVIIPAYNTAAFIGETLESVFAQTFSDFEVIVINDGSPESDELEQVLTPFRERIFYLKQENRGPAGARNTGIRHAQGKYLAFLDSDDSWLPDYLASQMNLFEEVPPSDVVFSDALHFGDPDLAGKTYMQTCPSNGPVTLESLMNEDCQVITSCTIALRHTVLDAGLFDERVDLRGCEDYDLWLRILHRGGRIVYQKRVLGRYRSRPGSLSQNSVKMLAALVAVYEKAEKTLELREETCAILKKQLTRARAHLDLELGKRFLTIGDFNRAKDSLTKANLFFHRAKLKLAILGLRLAPRLTRLGVITWQRLVLGSDLVKSIPALRPD
jgi:glycosyltransferase involved in cell wall biosynthesis